jgi:alpha-tubulin suppressor-like RCC1 family protein
MAITDKKTGVWGLDQVFDKQNQGSIWYLAQSLHSWGNAEVGALGQGGTSSDDRSSPVQIGSSTNWKRLSRGSHSKTVAVMNTSGVLYGWGRNDHGGFGNNSSSPSDAYSPVEMCDGATWAAFASWMEGFVATKTDGTAWGWGESYYGEIGHNDNGHPAQKSSPVQIPGTTWGTTRDTVSAHKNGIQLIKTDGTMWMTGQNSTGQLGQGNKTQYSSPVQIPGTTWAKTNIGGENFTAAIKTDGTLWMWGYNNTGQLGQNNTTDTESPVQVPGTTWRSVDGTYQSTLATKTDGTLWSWGYNDRGRLGLNDTTNYSSPKQVGSGTDWSETIAIAAGNTASAAMKTDGTLWVWGWGNQGQLGQNATSNVSSPVQVPGNWVDVTNNAESTLYGLKG